MTLPILPAALHILAQGQLRPSLISAIPTKYRLSTIPLQSILDLVTSNPGDVRVTVLVDTAIAYPLHSTVVNRIYDKAFDANPRLVEDFRLDIIPSFLNKLKDPSSSISTTSIAARILLSCVRAHEEILALTLEDSEDLLRSLSAAYSRLGTGPDRPSMGDRDKIAWSTRSEILMICRELLDNVGLGASADAMIRFMGEPSASLSGTLQGVSLRDDWASLFGEDRQAGRGVSGEVRAVLETLRDDEAKKDLVSVCSICSTPLYLACSCPT